MENHQAISEHILFGCPRDCYDTCRLRAYVDGTKVVRVIAEEDKYAKGITCPRAAKDVDRIYSPARVLYPHISVGGGVFRRVDWNTALDLIVSRLKEVLNNYGPEHVLFLEYAGNRGILTRNASRRLWNFLGITQTDRSLCDYSGARALRLTYGSTYGIFPDDIDELKMAIVWGFNPAVSAPHLWRRILDIKSRNGYIITVDVRSSETAQQSTRLINVRPGSDGVLALGLAKYLIECGYVDTKFINDYVYGFNSFKDYITKYNLNYVERFTGVPKEVIVELAEAMVNYKPFGIFIGYGLQRRYGGGEIVRSISLLPALLGIHRGFYYSNTDGLMIDFETVEGSDKWRPKNIVSMEKISEMISMGIFKFIYVHLHNPVATLPNNSKIVEGFKRDDVFVVVHETHWSDTAKAADLVIPAPTFYEKLDLIYSYSHNTVYLNKPAIEPLGESVGEYQVMCEIAKKIAPNHYMEICLDPYRILEIAVGKTDLEKLLINKSLSVKTKPKNTYQTNTGKIELYSTIAGREGIPHLPSPPEEDYGPSGEYVLISSAHPLYIHTQFEEVYGFKPSYIHLNPRDAEKLGVSTEDMVKVWNEKSSILMKVLISNDLSEGVVWAPRQAHTLDGKRINALLNDDVDTYGGSVLNSTRVKIMKVKLDTINSK
ncbi:MAG: molybdopterin-dependent oxidoreductase [Sulfolobales archaeon]